MYNGIILVTLLETFRASDRRCHYFSQWQYMDCTFIDKLIHHKFLTRLIICRRSVLQSSRQGMRTISIPWGAFFVYTRPIHRGLDSERSYSVCIRFPYCPGWRVASSKECLARGREWTHPRPRGWLIFWWRIHWTIQTPRLYWKCN